MVRLTADIRFAFRQILRAPSFALVVILTLTLGIGSTSAIFTFVRGVLLRPLPYPDPQELVQVCETSPEYGSDWCGASPTNWQDWARMSQTLQSIGLARTWPFSIKREERRHGIRGGIVTPGLFQTFRVQPFLGRLIEPRDIEPGRERTAVISYEFWQSWFGGGPDVLGQRLDLDGEVHEIVGVLPARFKLPAESLGGVEVWIPLWPERLAMRGWRGFIPYARLADGATVEQARAEFQTIHDQLAREYPETNKAWGVLVDSLHERKVRSVRTALLMLQGAVFLVLLIACANVANLLLARGTSREREFAVRLALGAGRRRLIAQQLAESSLYGLLGGVGGILLAVWARDLFAALAPSWFPRLAEVRIDLFVLVFVAAVSILTGLLFGLVSALHAGERQLSEALRSGIGQGAQRHAGRTRSVLVVAEIALASLLLVNAGLLIRSFSNLTKWEPGFDRESLLVVFAFASHDKFPTGEQITDHFRQCVDAIRTVPGVLQVGSGSSVPLRGGDGEQEFWIEGRPVPPVGQRPSVAWFDVGSNYFRTLAIPLLSGRDFTDADRKGAPLVGIINETMARRFWPDSNPIGQRVHLVTHKATLEVVGVVGDVQPFRPDEAPGPSIYWPIAQFPRGGIQFVMRTASSPTKLAAAVRSRLEEFDPDLSIGTFYTMDELVDLELVDSRFHTSLLAIFAGLALLIAAVGIYGVMSFEVAQRTREIGVRVALGAHRADILRMVLRRGTRLALVGVLIGLLGALAVTRLLESLLVQVAPTDPATFAVTGLAGILIAVLACWIPARRATRVDPMVALRYE